MRTKEQFKAYVYMKADEKKLSRKKDRANLARGAVAFSLLFIVGGVYLYSNASEDNMTAEIAVGNGNYYVAQDGIAAFEGYGMIADLTEEESLETQSAIVTYSKNHGESSHMYVTEAVESVPERAFVCDDFNYDTVSGNTKAGEPGVKTEGFVNTTENRIENADDALQLAEKECTIDYDTTSVSYDSSNDVWMILFSTENTLGGCQTVYINGDGTTCLVVYGE